MSRLNPRSSLFFSLSLAPPPSLPAPSLYPSLPLPSRFKMRPDIQSYHLGGMGCGTGVMGINLMRDLLKVGVDECGGRGRCVFGRREGGRLRVIDNNLMGRLLSHLEKLAQK